MDGGNLLAHGWFLTFVIVFFQGILTSLTPCVYPLIPITMSIFGARGDSVSRGRAMALASMYVGGIGVMYASLGIFSALAGIAFGTFMANAWIMVPIAILFLVMAASMFGAFELNLPTSLQTRLSAIGGKGFGGAFAMGLVGGIIAAPCTGPVLATLLAYVSTTRSVVMGGALLFTYALGMGVLFFAIAAFAVALPKSGAWMEAVKSIFGIMMVVAALYFLRNVSPQLAHYGKLSPTFPIEHAVAILFGAAIGGIHLSFHATGAQQIRKAFGLFFIVAGIFGLIAWSLTPRPLQWTYGEDKGVAAARAAHKPAVIDFFADWCIPCKEMDVKTFSDEKVASELGRFQLVKMDCSSDDDPKVKETTARYHADTLPTIVLMSSDGKVALKIDHFTKPAELLPLLRNVH
ncbi:MAG TPA: cytochrome c biogenesis protein CcdA [Polyangia bacterium]|jgi:thiol:disulfide interchange protein DsbD|nr:cytochrome c biogenesis protein CcdA [Polyangia bacterium]HWE27832.1 cytochrome c biogenesis protein CcdA [Polyangia bacterium]